jgi:glycyl-tRNA synthetase beta chain
VEAEASGAEGRVERPGRQTVAELERRSTRQDGRGTLLLEIGTEELPPASVGPALEQLARDLAVALEQARLPSRQPRTAGTARRLVVTVDGVPPRQEDRVTSVRGPAAAIAFDAEGGPTRAAEGFARAQGVPVGALRVVDMEGGRYVVAEIREPGRPAEEVLGQILPRIVAGLSFPKSMRWGPTGFRFGRPIRWVVALLDSRVIPMEIAGIRAGRRTYGHRFLAPAAMVLPEARAYAAAMRRARVLLDPGERRRRIVQVATRLAAGSGGVPIVDQDLCDELVWSSEHPTPLLGTFDPDLARTLPREVVLVTLQRHQKCFGVQDGRGELLAAFIAVRDGGSARLASVRTGHEWVVRARLEDARFFMEEDRRGSFDLWNAGLARLAHVAGLGTVADHLGRVRAVAARLAETLGLSPADRRALERAALLCKADLVTALVREFPELQGTVGRIYAQAAGEDGAVATAIEEHYWPKAAGGPAPATLPGALLAVADRAVLLAGALLAGMEPSGSQDPYGLRRAASGVVAVLLAAGLPLELSALFGAASAQYEHPPEERERAARTCVEFVLQRLRTVMLDRGMAYDTADAALGAESDDPVDLMARAQALHELGSDPVMARLATGFARASRILDQGAPAPEVDEGRVTEPAEVELLGAWRAVAAEVEDAAGARRYGEALQALARLADPIDRFFDDVMVMVPDLEVRANRLALLRDVAGGFLRVADFSRLVA